MNKLSYFNYSSDNYYDFSNGVPSSDGEINLWIREMFDDIKKKINKNPSRDEYFQHRSTGNTKVIMEVYRQEPNINSFTVYVSVATAYKSASKCDVQL